MGENLPNQAAPYEGNAEWRRWKTSGCSAFNGCLKGIKAPLESNGIDVTLLFSDIWCALHSDSIFPPWAFSYSETSPLNKKSMLHQTTLTSILVPCVFDINLRDHWLPEQKVLWHDTLHWWWEHKVHQRTFVSQQNLQKQTLLPNASALSAQMSINTLYQCLKLSVHVCSTQPQLQASQPDIKAFPSLCFGVTS